MSSDEARAEAERRMQEQREQVGLMVVEQTRFVEGFAQGAEWQAGRDAERIAALEAEAERLRMLVPPCDGGCSYGDGPQEDCSAHGRRPAELWEIIQQEAAESRDAQYRAEAAEAKLEVVRAYCTENTAGMPDDPFAYGIQQLRRVLAVLDGESGQETKP